MGHATLIIKALLVNNHSYWLSNFCVASIIQSVTMALERSVAQYETNQDG